jgi:hypothetical protein
MKTITIDELHAALRAQGVPREHMSVKCPVCRTVQSFSQLVAAVKAATPEHMRAYFGKADMDPEEIFGFDCIGRVTGAGPWKGEGDTPGRGCNWTLSGFLKAHRLEVISAKGERVPFFEPATPEEAQALLLREAA